MIQRLILVVSSYLYAALAWAALNYTVNITAPSELVDVLTDNLDLTAKPAEEIDQALLNEWVKATPQAVQKILETAGYFQSSCQIVDQGNNHYLIKVSPGKQTLIKEARIKLLGPIQDEPDYSQRLQAVLDAWTLPVGAPFNQHEWDNSKRTALHLIAADRFPLAHIHTSIVQIQPDIHQATLNMEIDSGPRIVFGDIRVHGLKRYPERIVTGMANFTKGTNYTQNTLLEYQADLGQLPHFSSAIVTADLAHISHQAVPINVDIVESPRQKLELGLTMDSEEGAGTRIAYDHYNIFKRGYTGSIVSNWQKNQQSFALGLAFPRRSSGYSHAVSSDFKIEDIQGLKTHSKDIGVWRIRSRNNIDARLGVEYLSESEEAGNTSTKYNYALQLVYGWSQRKLDDMNDPRNGLLLTGQISTAPEDQFASTTYVRGYSKVVSYWTPVPSYGKLVTRLELGQVWAKKSQNVPSSILFRAGGPNSVRGYEYQSLGLPGPNGSVLGGQVLAVGSLEYQIPIQPKWYLALFTDAGNATEDWGHFSLKYGRGIGVRWISPIAPLSFDIAKGQSGGKIRWNLSLGLAL